MYKISQHLSSNGYNHCVVEKMDVLNSAGIFFYFSSILKNCSFQLKFLFYHGHGQDKSNLNEFSSRGEITFRMRK